MLGRNFEKIDNVLFPVGERKLQIINPDGDDYPYKNKKALVNVETGAPLGIVGSGYEPVDNREVMEKMDSLFTKGGIQYELERGFTRKNNTETGIELRFPERKFNVDGNDGMELRGFLRNNFTGNGGVSLEFGFFRYVCLNGMITGVRDMDIRIPHLEGVNDRIVTNVIEALENNYNYSVRRAKNLTQTTFPDKESVKVMFEAWPIVAKRYQQQMEAKWDSEGQSLNGWQIFNLYTWVITHQVKAQEFAKMDMLRKLSGAATLWMAGQTLPSNYKENVVETV